MRKFRLGIAGLGVLVIAGASALVASGAFPDTNVWPYAENDRAPVLVTVGDVACQPDGVVPPEDASQACTQGRWQAQTATANQIEALKPDLVALLGDEQYQNGYLKDFQDSFDRTYGAFKFLHRPSPGNHEYYDNKGQAGVRGFGYFDYYNGYQTDPNTGNPINVTVPGGTAIQPQPRPFGQAGPFGTNADGWYSYDLGSWHIISLNVECQFEAGGCAPAGTWVAAETQWLAQDLQNSHASCTLVYWHQPAFSATNSPSNEGAVAKAAWWPLLYQHGVDVVLNGHDHVYARFAPMNPAGNPDPKKGIREFIVGTGGESLDALATTAFSPSPAIVTNSYYGVMALTLDKNSYSWNFSSALTATPTTQPPSYSDTGSDRCHGPNGERRDD